MSLEKMRGKTKTYAYYCPICGTWSGDMPLKSERRQVTKEEMRKDPNIATELLLCACGRTWSWFELEERFEGFMEYE